MVVHAWSVAERDSLVILQHFRLRDRRTRCERWLLKIGKEGADLVRWMVLKFNKLRR